ncbi:MAG: murein biosynthesis integral membrane protein MurJ [bacterium]|nr:murein biosynthesis integral membrane protein MurJ [bacterium]
MGEKPEIHPSDKTAPGAPGEGGGIARSAWGVSVATLGSRIFGFVRDILVAHFLGAGLVTDAFFVGFGIPSLFRRLFAEGALTSSFIPVYTQMRSAQGEEASRRFAGAMGMGLGAVLVVVCGLGIVFSDYFVMALAPGFIRAPEKFALASQFTRIMFPFLFFIGMSAVASGILNCARWFFIPALSPAVHNVAMIAALAGAAYFVGESAGALWLAWGVVAGGVLQLLVQLSLLRQLGLIPLPAAPWRAPGVRRALVLMGPAAFGVAVLQINILIDRWLASFLAEGAISYLYYANRLVQFPHALLSLAVTTAAFPVLAAYASAQSQGRVRATLAESGKLTLFLTLPATFGLIALAPSIMEVLFERGAFGAADTAASALGLRMYALGLIFFGGVRLFAAVFHAHQNMRYPVRCANIGMAANVVLSLALMFPLGFAGLALATSISSGLNVAFLARGLKREGEMWPGRELGDIASRLAPISILMGVFVFVLNAYFWPAGAGIFIRALFLCAEIAAGGLLYLGLCRKFAPGAYIPVGNILRRRKASGPESP